MPHETKLTLSKELDHNEAATVLAALRFWQEHRESGGSVPDYFDHFNDARELNSAEIDRLCEQINLVPVRLLENQRTAIQAVTDALHDLIDAVNGDIFTDSPECAFSVAKVHSARDHANRVLELAQEYL